MLHTKNAKAAFNSIDKYNHEKSKQKKNHEDIFAFDGKYILGITNVSYSVTKSSNRSAVSFNLHYKIKSKSI